VEVCGVANEERKTATVNASFGFMADTLSSSSELLRRILRVV
jgi:hypothetical protein